MFGIDVIMSGPELWKAQTRDGEFLAMTNTIGLLEQKVRSASGSMPPEAKNNQEGIVSAAEPAEPAEPAADTFKAGDIVVWSSKDGEKVGRVEVSFGDSRIKLTIPHNTLDQTNAPYVEPSRCRIATTEEIAEAEALQELENLINQTYHTGIAVKEKAKLSDKGTELVVYRCTGKVERLHASNYQLLLQKSREFIQGQCDAANLFAKEMERYVTEKVVFVDWRTDAAGDMRVLYRMDGELWSYTQLYKLYDIILGQRVEHEARLKERDERISELEKNTMQADTQRKRDNQKIEKLKEEIKHHKQSIQELEDMLESERAEIEELEKSLKRYAELEAA